MQPKLSIVLHLFTVYSLSCVASLSNTNGNAFSGGSSNNTGDRTNDQLKQFIGIDLGTSGARLSVVQSSSSTDNENINRGTPTIKEVASASVQWNTNNLQGYDHAPSWIDAVEQLWQQTRTANNVEPSHICAICVSGTSASCVIVDTKGSNGHLLTREPRMYNYHVTQSTNNNNNNNDAALYSGVKALDLLKKYVPDKHTAQSATGTLAKLLSWHVEKPFSKSERLLHQADYVGWKLFLCPEKNNCGSAQALPTTFSDWHNSLKLGYDVQNLQWPPWLTTCLDQLGIPMSVLPNRVVSPGSPIDTITSSIAKRWGIPENTVLVGGTTDSNAALVAATGLNVEPGTAVTSLGSTLALKLISTEYVEDATLGVYSHRLPSPLLPSKDDNKNSNDNSYNELWLVGGASNVGCAILRQENFSNEELAELSKDIDANSDSLLNYYPLTKPGERFPIADSNLKPILEPKPDNRRHYLHGLLQGICAVEEDGYKALADLGCQPKTPHTILTSGGGSRNPTWTAMRERRLRKALSESQSGDNDNIRVCNAENVEASYGAALLAASTFIKR